MKKVESSQTIAELVPRSGATGRSSGPVVVMASSLLLLLLPCCWWRRQRPAVGEWYGPPETTESIHFTWFFHLVSVSAVAAAGDGTGLRMARGGACGHNRMPCFVSRPRTLNLSSPTTTTTFKLSLTQSPP